MKKYESLIKEIARIYFISLNNINGNKISSGEVDYFSPFYRYYIDVEETFRTLDSISQEIITKEYFYDGYPNWWIDKYDIKEFKKKKRIAVRDFVEAFYEIH